MPECKDIIYYVISFIGVLITAFFSFLIWKTTKKSNELIKLFSSEKPFLKLVTYKNSEENFLSPVIEIINCGPGHAVNVNVEVCVNTKQRNNIFVKYDGTNIIPFYSDEKIYKYEYRGVKEIFMPYEENQTVKITYESPAGYKDSIIWKVNGDEFIVIK